MGIIIFYQLFNMKFATLAVVALFGNVIAQEEDAAEEGDDMEIPAEAIGDCADSSECAEGEFCVFTHVVPEEGADKTWNPSACGAEADCNAEEDGSTLVAGDEWSWCMEFMEDKEGEEEGSMRLVATMAASFTALALSM